MVHTLTYEGLNRLVQLDLKQQQLLFDEKFHQFLRDDIFQPMEYKSLLPSYFLRFKHHYHQNRSFELFLVLTQLVKALSQKELTADFLSLKNFTLKLRNY